RLLDDIGNVLQTSNPDLETDAQITYSVTIAGRYYLEIRGVGRGDPLADGYTDYASLGQYYISGTVPEDVVSTAPPVAPDDLMATLVDDVNIDLDWTDPPSTAETNEAFYRVMRSVDGGAFALRASLPRNSEFYSDNNLADGDYVYMLELHNGAGMSQTVATDAIDVTAPVVAVATSELTVAGSVQSGSYLSTQVSAGSEQLKEQHTGGRPSRRVSSLEHSWTIPGVVPSATVELYLRAYAPFNDEGDDFDFTYSVDSVEGGLPQLIGTAINGAPAKTWTIQLPNDTAGTVVVQVVDTDRTGGNGGSDTLTVYEMHVTSAGPATDQPPVVAISEPSDGIMIGEGTPLVFSATVTDEDTNLAEDLTWSSVPAWLTGSGPSVAATLPMGDYVVTASAMDSASQPGADTVSVMVVAPDGTPPEITAPVDVVAEATGQATVVALGLPVVTDNIDPSPSVSNDALAAFPLGLTVVTWTATDASLNAASDTQNVTVNDTTAPTITVLGDNPASVVVDGVYVDDGATALDLVDGDVTAGIGVTGLSFDTSVVGSHEVTYAVTDAVGNDSQAIRTVNVVVASAVLEVSGISPNPINRALLPAGVSVMIFGTGLADVETVTFQNGSGPTPSAAIVMPTSADILNVVVSASSGGPRKPRYWDVVVTRANGVNAVCAGCLMISP
ncbi:MAG: immunoglobulin-like domain-containing protein, partial [Vicinamibacterales bacterium]